MFELNQVGERSYYINCPAKIGIYKSNDTDVYLIDSGNDKDADHIGGNKYLQQQTGCKIFADGIEAAFTKYPLLEPSFLYGGYPCKDLRHKFLLASESDVNEITDSDFPKELEVIPLHGHFFDMIGIRTPDDVVFLADCISSESTLDKYQITFIYDIAEYLNTLDKVESMEAAMFVPAHSDVTSDITGIVQLNRQKVFDISNDIQSILKTPMCFETLLKRLFDEYGLVMNFEQYVLIGSTVRSYLSWLKDNEKIKAAFTANYLMWSSL